MTQRKSLADQEENPIVLVIDNYDSFVYNLVQYLAQLGADVVVRRNDELAVNEIADGSYEDRPLAGILLSPGPGTPSDAGVCKDIIQAVADGEIDVPIFGVCLGHQAIGEVYGATVDRAPELLHGKTSQVYHQGVGVLADMPNPFTATRYHSLAVEEATIPAELEVTGHTESGVVMSLRHRTRPIEGVQFHPESVLTEAGHRMLAHWLVRCGYPEAAKRAEPLVAALEERRLAAFAA